MGQIIYDNLGNSIGERAAFGYNSEDDDLNRPALQTKGPFFTISDHLNPISFLRRQNPIDVQDDNRIHQSLVIVGATITPENLNYQGGNSLVSTLYQASRGYINLDVLADYSSIKRIKPQDFTSIAPTNLFSELRGIETIDLLSRTLTQNIPGIVPAICSTHRLIKLYETPNQKIYLNFGSEFFLAAKIPEIDINAGLYEDTLWFGRVVSCLHPLMSGQPETHYLFKRRIVDSLMLSLLEMTEIATIITPRLLGKTGEVFLESPFYNTVYQEIEYEGSKFHCYHLISPFEMILLEQVQDLFKDKSSNLYKTLLLTATKLSDSFKARFERPEIRISDVNERYTNVISYAQNTILQGLCTIAKNAYSLEELEVLYNTKA